MNHQHIVKSISSSFPTVWHGATKFGVNQVLMAVTTASISGISRICSIATFGGDGLMKTLSAYTSNGVVEFLKEEKMRTNTEVNGRGTFT